mgnify:CR=1 FL=1
MYDEFMAKCIYCLKDETETTFLTREHVIPQSFGTLTPLNPNIKGDIVCDSCNTKILSPLETNFIEDSMEGFFAQRLNLNNRNSITMRNDNFKVDTDSGFGHDFFNQMVFPLKPENEKLVPYPKTQVKFRGLGGQSCRVFFPEALKQIKKDSKDFQKLSADMKKLSQKDLCIFAETHEDMDEVIALLKDYGVTYNEKERHHKPFEEGVKYKLSEDYSCTVNHEIGRVLAKIAMNYFAYCCIQDKQESLLFLPNFDAIRNYIFKGDGKMRDFIVSVNEEPITYEENQSKKRIVSHVMNFVEEDGMIVVRMTFFGCPAIYKIILGKIPGDIPVQDFGCGHLFDPFSKRVINMANKPTPEELTAEQIRATFGIQKRYRFGTE